MIEKEFLIRRIKDMTTDIKEASTASIKTFVEAQDLETPLIEKIKMYSAVIWDKVSPINGIPASEYMKEEVFTSGNPSVYLISLNGNVIFFQPVTDENATETSIMELAKNQIEFLATFATIDDFINKYLETLN